MNDFVILLGSPAATLETAGSKGANLASEELIVPGDDDWPALEEHPPQPFDLWTRVNVGEVWPHPVSPLLWSGVTLTMNQGTRYSLGGLQAPYLDNIQWARRFYGRIYYNEGALVRILAQEFGLPGSFIDAAFGSRSSAGRRHHGRVRPLRLLRRLPLLVRMVMGRLGTDRELEDLFPTIDRWVAEFMARNLKEASDGELWTELRWVWVDRSTRVINLHTAVSASAMGAFSLLEKLLGRWCGRGDLAQDLVTGLSGVYAAEMGATLWQMAQRLRDLGLAGAVLNSAPDAALTRLRETPEAQPVIQMLDAFLERHGHRCPNEGEWLYPRWAEAPEQVVELVAGYLRAGDRANPVAAEERQRQRREEAVAWVEAHLDPLRRAVFRRVLDRAQHAVRLRDNGRHYVMRVAFPFVRIYRELGRRWASRGWLRQPEDVFFLTVPDVEKLIQAGDPCAAGMELITLVAERRKAYEYWFTVEAPEVIGPDGRPVAVRPTEPPAPLRSGELPEAVLDGIPASGGRVQGTARIIHDPGDATRLKRGDILVTRATDPGWTPVFPLVGGLVLEVGGQLSHGAIVAREYGLPAVVNVHDATRRIRDGQVITVDGTAGRVYLDR
ncbi:MAG: PEP-utilizing enzyme [Anaerolineae bacterium]